MILMKKIGFWYVIALAGQSNGMAYGEGIPLPDTLDKPESRVKQLARRKTITPGGKECKFNEIIPADHCLHDVQDMSGYHHPAADLHKGEYGCVGQGLHIAKSYCHTYLSKQGYYWFLVAEEVPPLLLELKVCMYLIQGQQLMQCGGAPEQHSMRT